MADKDTIKNYMTLSGNYVYYERLSTDFDGVYSNWYKSLKSDLMSNVVGEFDLNRSANSVRKVAEVERQKEIQVLQHIFKGYINVDIEHMNIKQLVQFMNIVLNDVDQFERNLALIQQSTGGQKRTANWFDYYIEKSWDSFSRIIAETAEKNILSGSSLEDSLVNAFNTHIDKIIDHAIELMANAEVESGINIDREKYKDAYKNLVNLLNKLTGTGNNYVNDFVQVFGINDIISELSKNATLNKNGKISRKSLKINKKITTKSSGKGRWGTQGTADEIFYQMIVNELSNLHFKIDGDIQLEGYIDNSIKATRVGGTGSGTDILVTAGISAQGIDNLVKEMGADPSKMGRLQNAVKFAEELKKYKDSFIIHVSAKDYTLNENFRKRGGYSTTVMTPESLNFALNSAGINRWNLITGILQLCEGAIGSEYKTNFENEIAQYFAYIFFDDVTEIGTSIPQSTATSIHVLYLNGIDVPLSVFLEYLADEIERESTKTAVRINISAPKIKWPEANKKAKPGDWETQRNEAMTQIKIHTHFLSKMQDFIKEIT